MVERIACGCRCMAGRLCYIFELDLCLVTNIVIPDQMTTPRNWGSDIIGDTCYKSGDGLALLDVVLLRR